jgi:hypothetical protein
MHSRIYGPIKRQPSPTLERSEVRELVPCDLLVRGAAARRVRHYGQRRRVGQRRSVEQ